MSVRNLRAMFENKTQESPPDRGRSPAGTESPRPLSKVRTSFVAIEKDGRIGLQQRNPSEASSMSGRKLSEDTEALSSVQPDDTSTTISTATTAVSEPPKEVANLVPSGPPKGLAESPQIKEDPRARKSDYGSHARKSQEAGDQAPATPAEGPAVGQENKTNGVKAVEVVATPVKSTPVTSAAPAAPVADDVKKANGVKAAETPLKSTPAKSIPAKSTPAAAAKPAVSAQPAEAPGAKGPAGPGRAAGASGPAVSTPAAAAAAPFKKVTTKELVMSPDPVPQPKPASKPTNTTSHPPTTPKAAISSTEKKAAPPSASPGGFVKPRPKSPTRPVKLPPSLTTHTTASGSRSRTTGSAPPPSHENSARSASRSKALGRSSSAAGRQRPSIGPPPKLPAKDHPPVKKDAKVDEGFLARMMRPTQASASKKNEKVPVTPPRRAAAAAAPKKSASAKSVPTRRPVSKTTSTTTSAAPSPERTKKESSADRDIATVIEKMSIAENVQETPKTPEREATIAEELEEEKSAVPEPEVEEAVAPLANGNHKEEAEGPASADVTESKSKTEQAVSQVANTEAQPEQEEW